jgi:hypothetical protein
MLALTYALATALVNTLAAWALLHRSPWAAGAYFFAAVATTVGGVAAAYRAPEAVAIVAVGAIVASAASLRVAWVGLRRPPTWRLVVRAVAGAVAVLLAALAVRF